MIALDNLNNVIVKPIEDEMRNSFLAYSMSVITQRSLIDVRDGLKPVHRRILYSMNENGMTSNKAFYKSARIVGDVIGKYHPHGDSSVYDALVRLSQKWNMLHPLIEGQGNFGSIDGDPAAAMRYTEARMSKLSEELLTGIKKNTVEFRENYDGREKEPVVLPGKFPQALVNGNAGIAVGMASEMVPHNLKEVVDGIVAVLKNEDITIEELMQYIPSPDFPTGGTILGTDGIEKAYKTGRGSLTVRGKAHIEEIDGGYQIVITQVPYKVGTDTMVEKIKEVQQEYDEWKKKNRNQKENRFFVKQPKKALDFAAKDGVYADFNENTNEENLRIVVELKKGKNPAVVLNHLYKYTPLQTTVSINNTVLIPSDNGKTKPKCLGLKQLITEYIKHQMIVTRRETQFDLNQKQKEFYELEGLGKALKDLDRTLKIIRQADSDREAIDGLMNLLRIEEAQAKYILDRRIRQISNMEQKKIIERLDEITTEVNRLQGILADDEKIKELIINHLNYLKENYGQERRTVLGEAVQELSMEDLIQNEKIVTTLSNNGYIKGTKENHYRTQRRNGRGVNSMGLDEDDFVKHLDILNKHDYLLLFTNLGKVFSLKGYDIPETQSRARGVHISNLLPGLEENENIQSVVSVKDFSDSSYLFFSTAKGKVKKTPLSDYKNIRRSGILAIDLEEKDTLVNVSLTNGDNSIVLITRFGQAIKFSESSVRKTSRDTQGVKGISLREGDYVISSDIDESFGELFIITEHGYGKRSDLNLFKLQARGGVGVKAIKTNDKTGNVIGSLIIDKDDSVFVLSAQGSLIKLRGDSLSQFSRVAQGTKVINLREGDKVQTIARLSDEDQEQDESIEV